MGSGVTKVETVLDENAINPSLLNVPFYKGSPATLNSNMYDIGYKIGEGSFAVVRVATHTKNKDKVAIKEVYTLDLTKTQLEELNAEMNILSQLKHPNIVRLKEVFKNSSHVYLVTEYLSGGELFDAICEQEFYKEGDARKVMCSVLSAILYCHQRGVMHRDLKPENLILVNSSRNTDIKIIDFGFVTPFGPNISKPTELCGTPGYVAPEMLNNQPYGPEVDMWSMGVILYVLLAGMPPFASSDVEELFSLIKTGNFSFPEEFWGEVGNGAKDLIRRLLVLDPKARLTAEEMAKHPWMSDETNNRDITKNLNNMRKWNAGRRTKAAGLAVKSCIKFSLAGKRYRQTFLAAAARAKDLENKGINWFQDPKQIAAEEATLSTNGDSERSSEANSLSIRGPKLELVAK